MIKMMGNKIITILRSKILLNWSYMYGDFLAHKTNVKIDGEGNIHNFMREFWFI